MAYRQTTFRLPMELRDILRSRAEQNRRTVGGELQVLLESALKAEGVEVSA